MNGKAVLSITLISLLMLSGCGKNDAEGPINYISWLEGEWQIEDVVTWGETPVSVGWDIVQGYVGTKYDFLEPLSEEPSGGVVPIRDMEYQPFFHGEGYLYELGVTGNYYAMFWIDAEEWGGTNTCFVIKDKDDWLAWKGNYGIYQLRRTRNAMEQVHTYDANLSFEQNIKIRMEEQGIRSHWYYHNVWSGNWTIEEVVYTEDMAEAQTHIGEIASYHNYYDDVNYFDLNFIESGEDRVFYHMPTTDELGLYGVYYLLLWDEDNEYPAAIVKSEHEMFLIQGNTLFRAVQEEEYFDDALLQGL